MGAYPGSMAQAISRRTFGAEKLSFYTVSEAGGVNYWLTKPGLE